MQIQLDDSARQLGIDKAYLLSCSNLGSPEQDLAAFENKLAATEKLIRTTPIDDSIFAKSFHKMFTLMGYPSTVPAGIKINRRVRESGIKRISPIIDAYNIVSAKYCLGIGAHDARQLTSEKICLRRSRSGEVIQPLFSETTKSLPVGDLVYSNNECVIAWLGKKDVDSDNFKITSITDSVFFLLIGRDDIPKGSLELVAQDITDHLSLCYPQLSENGAFFE